MEDITAWMNDLRRRKGRRCAQACCGTYRGLSLFAGAPNDIEKAMLTLMWNDPLGKDEDPWNTRLNYGDLTKFTSDDVVQCLGKGTTLIRGHELVTEGVEKLMNGEKTFDPHLPNPNTDGLIITVFSCPNYERKNNVGGYLILSQGGGQHRTITFSRKNLEAAIPVIEELTNELLYDLPRESSRGRWPYYYSLLENNHLIEEKDFTTSNMIFVFGDIHTSIVALHFVHKMMSEHIESDVHFIFLGDYVDRVMYEGDSSEKVLYYLFEKKLQYPDKITLLRGNHETKETNRKYGFHQEMKKAGRDQQYDLWNRLFHLLPVGLRFTYHGKSYFCTHGGVGGGGAYTPNRILEQMTTTLAKTHHKHELLFIEQQFKPAARPPVPQLLPAARLPQLPPAARPPLTDWDDDDDDEKPGAPPVARTMQDCWGARQDLPCKPSEDKECGHWFESPGRHQLEPGVCSPVWPFG